MHTDWLHFCVTAGMSKIKIAVFSFLALVLIYTQSCEKGNNDTRVSQNGGYSHNAGRNCMDCHNPNGEGSGWFNAAGTVYASTGSSIHPNATVYLYTNPNGRGSIVDSLYGDGSGSFYTTSSINFGSGLYPAVVGSNGAVKYMVNSISQGACNGCHGVSTAKIWTY